MMNNEDRSAWPVVADASSWLAAYFGRMRQSLDLDGVKDALIQARDLMLHCQGHGGKVILAGNGASASIASHAAVDFTKQARVRAIAFNDANLITCYGNDYGYESWIQAALCHHATTSDLVVLISASGRSPNVVQAGEYARDRGLPLLTLTGCEENNPLRMLGDNNLWVDSRAYNIIECTHMFWLAAICDLIVGQAEYTMPGNDEE
jgi:D-sedoheptulose 7-phosphate isomerase